MKIFSVAVTTLTLCAPLAYAQTKPAAKHMTPAEVSAESADEEPDEQGMEKEESEAKINDKSSSAKGLGLDRNPLGNKKSTGEAPSVESQSEELDEAADDILDQSFSQPGVDQNTGHVKKNLSGEARVNVPKKSAPDKGVAIGTKPKVIDPEAEEQQQAVIITDKTIIKKIQKALIKKGAQINADGVMGATTVAAIKDFQSDNGLKPDGNPGPTTMAKLGIVYIKK